MNQSLLNDTILSISVNVYLCFNFLFYFINNIFELSLLDLSQNLAHIKVHPYN